MSKNKIIAAIEAEQMSKDVPAFSPGDTVTVQVKVKEGDRERLQAFEGVVMCGNGNWDNNDLENIVLAVKHSSAKLKKSTNIYFDSSKSDLFGDLFGDLLL